MSPLLVDFAVADMFVDGVRLTGFYKTHFKEDCFQYLVKSNAIFTPAQDPTSDTSPNLINLVADSMLF